jgi:uncharacterized Rossmann fold enzyme
VIDVEFHEWDPVYAAILEDFGFPREADERARDLLADLAGAVVTLGPADLDFSGETVAIAGAYRGLAGNVGPAERADTVVAASDAAPILWETGVDVDCYVTDLDARRERAAALAAEGVPTAVHAHGDNMPAVREHVPELDLEWVLPTTQAEPAAGVHNVGGFTDGDRAAFLADHCGAERLTFLGWGFEDPTVTPVKRHKLRWAERLLRWLELRRGESFSILDGRREGIDESVLPV